MEIQLVDMKRNGGVFKVPFFLMREEEYQDLTADQYGLCLYCGAESECVEPDACGYKCEACGMNKVYGAENALLMGRIKIKGDE